MEKKITKRERFTEMRGMFAEMGREDLVAFIDHEIELLNKKAEKSGTSKKQVENKGIKETLLAELVAIGKPVTITDFLKQSGVDYSNQKVSAMFRQMIEEGTVAKTSDKGKSLFFPNAE